MLVGLDLDNTIIDYSTTFARASVDMDLLPEACVDHGKEAIKALVRAGPHGERGWMRLQGQVYGALIGLSRPYPGVAEFIRDGRARGHKLIIVSHKTRFGHYDPARVDLWEAARGFLLERGLVGELGIDERDVHFLETREEKIRKIAELECDAFVDDLPEVLCSPEFPESTRRILFADDAAASDLPGVLAVRAWADMTAAVFGPTSVSQISR